MSIFVRAKFAVDEPLRAEFETVAMALRDQAADEPGTHTYRWFSAAPGSYVVIEEYADGAAVADHNRRGAEHLSRVRRIARMVSAELYGDIGPELREWVRSRPQATAFPDLLG